MNIFLDYLKDDEQLFLYAIYGYYHIYILLHLEYYIEDQEKVAVLFLFLFSQND